MILFGAGGVLVEVFKDRALGPAAAQPHAGPPADGADADLQGAAGRARPEPSVDLDQLETLLVRFSQLLCDFLEMQEMDINPLLAVAGADLLALDARVLLRRGPPPSSAAAGDPAVPEPVHDPVHARATAPRVTVRAIRPEDEPLIIDLHAGAVGAHDPHGASSAWSRRCRATA